MNTKKIGMLLGLCLFLTACFGLGSGTVVESPSPSPSLAATATVSPPTPSPTPAPPVVYRAKLGAIGDVLVHESVYRDAALEDGGFDFRPMLEPVRDIMLQYDLLIANQESMIGGVELGLTGYPRFNSPHEVGDALLDAGVNMITMANNHTIDRGERAVLSAIDHWNSLGMPYTGAFSSQEDKEQLRVLDIEGISFSILAYSYGTNGIPVPEGKDYLVNLIDPEQMRPEIEAAREVSDVVVAALHWGLENQPEANNEQRQLAQQLADWGVDIIIGTHPHILQTFEWIEREDGSRTLVMYSLGNFLSAQSRMTQLLGGIGQVDVIKTVDQGETTIVLENPAIIPTYNRYSNWRNFLVIPLQDLGEEDWQTIGSTWSPIRERLETAMPELDIKD